MYNQHTRGIMTAGHRDLDERGGKTLLETSRTHIHTQKKKEKKTHKKNKKQKKIYGKKTVLSNLTQRFPVYRVSCIATKPFFAK